VTITFAELTTLRVGGPIGRLVVVASSADAVETMRECDDRGEPVLIMGGGSNLVVGDVGWAGTVVKMASTGIEIDGEIVTVAAGVDWDGVVQASVGQGLAGLESLSGVPGSAGGTPVQNVGAYGTETSDVLKSLSVYDRHTGQVERWEAARCEFGSHRQSVFKHSDRWVVLDVTFRLHHRPESAITFEGLAEAMGVDVGARAPIGDIRAAVLDLRRKRKMVLDPDDHDTWSVGSFFINPVLGEVPDSVPEECRRWPDPDGVKLPAGWLVDHAGFPPGYGLDFGNGTVALSSRHALAVTNRGGATTGDVMRFAAHIREGVEARFDVRLGPECDLVNCAF
jgi:UDP-N-acetylmuramate dehydrogenase